MDKNFKGCKMVKEKWETVHRGIAVKKHPSRKHGIKPDIYYAARFQFNGKRTNSGLGWASDGWTLEKAIIELKKLKDKAKAGGGVETHRKKQVKADEELREKERQKKEALEKEAKDNMPLDDYFKNIYYPAISQEKKKKTASTEEHLFRLWISKIMGKKPFKNISAFDLERLKKEMLKADRAPRTIEYALTTLGQIFRHAIRLGYFTGTIPTTQVKKPKYDNKKIRFLSQDEAHILLNNLKNASQQMHDMSLLALHCGLRAGEIFSLTWKDVDLDHGLITLLDTKSGKTRVLSITNDIKFIFEKKGPGPMSELVFQARGGGKIKKISKSFSRAVEDAGFNDGIDDRRQKVTFHTLRHTFASWLVMEGISLYEVKELLGHASLTMTERYSHLAPDRNRRASATMEKLFKKKPDEDKKEKAG